MAVTEKYLKGKFTHKYVVFGWFGYLNNLLGNGLKDGSGSFLIDFQEKKI
jgi:hypothetical protein